MGNSQIKELIDLSPRTLALTSVDDKVWLGIPEENLFNDSFTIEKYYMLQAKPLSNFKDLDHYQSIEQIEETSFFSSYKDRSSLPLQQQLQEQNKQQQQQGGNNANNNNSNGTTSPTATTTTSSTTGTSPTTNSSTSTSNQPSSATNVTSPNTTTSTTTTTTSTTANNNTSGGSSVGGTIPLSLSTSSPGNRLSTTQTSINSAFNNNSNNTSNNTTTTNTTTTTTTTTTTITDFIEEYKNRSSIPVYLIPEDSYKTHQKTLSFILEDLYSQSNVNTAYYTTLLQKRLCILKRIHLALKREIARKKLFDSIYHSKAKTRIKKVHIPPISIRIACRLFITTLQEQVFEQRISLSTLKSFNTMIKELPLLSMAGEPLDCIESLSKWLLSVLSSNSPSLVKREAMESIIGLSLSQGSLSSILNSLFLIIHPDKQQTSTGGNSSVNSNTNSTFKKGGINTNNSVTTQPSVSSSTTTIGLRMLSSIKQLEQWKVDLPLSPLTRDLLFSTWPIQWNEHISDDSLSFLSSSNLNIATITCDGEYIYIHDNCGLAKIGTGYFGTHQGRVYARKSEFYPKEKGWLVYIGNHLYYRSPSIDQSTLLVLNPINLEEVGRINQDGSGSFQSFNNLSFPFAPECNDYHITTAPTTGKNRQQQHQLVDKCRSPIFTDGRYLYLLSLQRFHNFSNKQFIVDMYDPFDSFKHYKRVELRYPGDYDNVGGHYGNYGGGNNSANEECVLNPNVLEQGSFYTNGHYLMVVLPPPFGADYNYDSKSFVCRAFSLSDGSLIGNYCLENQPIGIASFYDYLNNVIWNYSSSESEIGKYGNEGFGPKHLFPSSVVVVDHPIISQPSTTPASTTTSTVTTSANGGNITPAPIQLPQSTIVTSMNIVEDDSEILMDPKEVVSTILSILSRLAVDYMPSVSNDNAGHLNSPVIHQHIYKLTEPYSVEVNFNTFSQLYDILEHYRNQLKVSPSSSSSSNNNSHYHHYHHHHGHRNSNNNNKQIETLRCIIYCLRLLKVNLFRLCSNIRILERNQQYQLDSSRDSLLKCIDQKFLLQLRTLLLNFVIDGIESSGGNNGNGVNSNTMIIEFETIREESCEVLTIGLDLFYPTSLDKANLVFHLLDQVSKIRKLDISSTTSSIPSQTQSGLSNIPISNLKPTNQSFVTKNKTSNTTSNVVVSNKDQGYSMLLNKVLVLLSSHSNASFFALPPLISEFNSFGIFDKVNGGNKNIDHTTVPILDQIKDSMNLFVPIITHLLAEAQATIPPQTIIPHISRQDSTQHLGFSLYSSASPPPTSSPAMRLLLAIQKDLILRVENGNSTSSSSSMLEGAPSQALVAYSKLLMDKCRELLIGVLDMDSQKNQSILLTDFKSSVVGALLPTLIHSLFLFSYRICLAKELLPSLVLLIGVVDRVNRRLPKLLNRPELGRQPLQKRSSFVEGPSRISESPHPYHPYTNARQSVTIPGAVFLSLVFDERSYTSTLDDVLQIYESADSKEPLEQFSSSKWPKRRILIPGDTVVFQFITGSVNTSNGTYSNYWGYRCNIIGHMPNSDKTSLPWSSHLEKTMCCLAGRFSSCLISGDYLTDLELENTHFLESPLFSGGTEDDDELINISDLQLVPIDQQDTSTSSSSTWSLKSIQRFCYSFAKRNGELYSTHLSDFMWKYITGEKLKGKATIKSAQQAIIASLIKHLGLGEISLNFSLEIIQNKQQQQQQSQSTTTNIVTLKPPQSLIDVWKSVLHIRIAIIQKHQESQLSNHPVDEITESQKRRSVDMRTHSEFRESIYKEIADKIIENSMFLLELQASENIGGGQIPLKQQELINNILFKFVLSNSLQIEDIKKIMLSRRSRATNRSLGLQAMKDILKCASDNGSMKHEVLCFIGPALRNSGLVKRRCPPYHYLDFLYGCGSKLIKDVKKNFKLLMEDVSLLLNDQNSDSILKLYALDAFTLNFSPDDSEMLTQVDIFNKIHSLMTNESIWGGIWGTNSSNDYNHRNSIGSPSGSFLHSNSTSSLYDSLEYSNLPGGYGSSSNNNNSIYSNFVEEDKLEREKLKKNAKALFKFLGLICVDITTTGTTINSGGVVDTSTSTTTTTTTTATASSTTKFESLRDSFFSLMATQLESSLVFLKEQNRLYWGKGIGNNVGSGGNGGGNSGNGGDTTSSNSGTPSGVSSPSNSNLKSRRIYRAEKSYVDLSDSLTLLYILSAFDNVKQRLCSITFINIFHSILLVGDETQRKLILRIFRRILPFVSPLKLLVPAISTGSGDGSSSNNSSGSTTPILPSSIPPIQPPKTIFSLLLEILGAVSYWGCSSDLYEISKYIDPRYFISSNNHYNLYRSSSYNSSTKTAVDSPHSFFSIFDKSTQFPCSWDILSPSSFVKFSDDSKIVTFVSGSTPSTSQPSSSSGNTSSATTPTLSNTTTSLSILSNNLETIQGLQLIKSDIMIPETTPFFYFEVKIENETRDIIVGLFPASNIDQLRSLKDWRFGLGYSSKDGNKVCYRITSTQSKPYSTSFTRNDVVGCGYNHKDGKVFFTKNGKYLGTAFKNVQGDFYPVVALSSGGSVFVNFGQQPFQYDLTSIIAYHLEFISEKTVPTMTLSYVNEIVYLLRSLMKCQNWKSQIQKYLLDGLKLLPTTIQSNILPSPIIGSGNTGSNSSSSGSGVASGIFNKFNKSTTSNSNLMNLPPPPPLPSNHHMIGKSTSSSTLVSKNMQSLFHVFSTVSLLSGYLDGVWSGARVEVDIGSGCFENGTVIEYSSQNHLCRVLLDCNVDKLIKTTHNRIALKPIQEIAIDFSCFSNPITILQSISAFLKPPPLLPIIKQSNTSSSSSPPSTIHSTSSNTSGNTSNVNQAPSSPLPTQPNSNSSMTNNILDGIINSSSNLSSSSSTIQNTTTVPPVLPPTSPTHSTNVPSTSTSGGLVNSISISNSSNNIRNIYLFIKSRVMKIFGGLLKYSECSKFTLEDGLIPILVEFALGRPIQFLDEPKIEKMEILSFLLKERIYDKTLKSFLNTTLGHQYTSSGPNTSNTITRQNNSLIQHHLKQQHIQQQHHIQQQQQHHAQLLQQGGIAPITTANNTTTTTSTTTTTNGGIVEESDELTSEFNFEDDHDASEVLDDFDEILGNYDEDEVVPNSNININGNDDGNNSGYSNRNRPHASAATTSSQQQPTIIQQPIEDEDIDEDESLQGAIAEDDLQEDGIFGKKVLWSDIKIGMHVMISKREKLNLRRSNWVHEMDGIIGQLGIVKSIDKKHHQVLVTFLDDETLTRFDWWCCYEIFTYPTSEKSIKNNNPIIQSIEKYSHSQLIHLDTSSEMALSILYSRQALISLLVSMPMSARISYQSFGGAKNLMYILKLTLHTTLLNDSANYILSNNSMTKLLNISPKNHKDYVNLKSLQSKLSTLLKQESYNSNSNNNSNNDIISTNNNNNNNSVSEVIDSSTIINSNAISNTSSINPSSTLSSTTTNTTSVATCNSNTVTTGSGNSRSKHEHVSVAVVNLNKKNQHQRQDSNTTTATSTSNTTTTISATSSPYHSGNSGNVPTPPNKHNHNYSSPLPPTPGSSSNSSSANNTPTKWKSYKPDSTYNHHFNPTTILGSSSLNTNHNIILGGNSSSGGGNGCSNSNSSSTNNSSNNLTSLITQSIINNNINSTTTNSTNQMLMLEPLKTGNLMKQQKIIKLWKRIYVVLSSDCLFFYKPQNSNNHQITTSSGTSGNNNGNSIGGNSNGNTIGKQDRELSLGGGTGGNINTTGGGNSNNNSINPIGSVDLRDIVSVNQVSLVKQNKIFNTQIGSKKDSFCFQITLTSNKTHLFQASSQDDLNDWIQIINSACISSASFRSAKTPTGSDSVQSKISLLEVLTRECCIQLRDTANEHTSLLHYEESPHPYPINYRTKKIIRIEGAQSLLITFDSKSYSEPGYAILKFFYDPSCTQHISSYSGKFNSFPPTIINSCQFWMVFIADSNRSEWGYKFTVTPIRMKTSDVCLLPQPNFEFACFIVDWVLQLDIGLFKNYPLFFSSELVDMLLLHLSLNQPLDRKLKAINFLTRLLLKLRENPIQLLSFSIQKEISSKIDFLKDEMFKIYKIEQGTSINNTTTINTPILSQYLLKLIELCVQTHIILSSANLNLIQQLQQQQQAAAVQVENEQSSDGGSGSGGGGSNSNILSNSNGSNSSTSININNTNVNVNNNYNYSVFNIRDEHKLWFTRMIKTSKMLDHLFRGKGFSKEFIKEAFVETRSKQVIDSPHPYPPGARVTSNIVIQDSVSLKVEFDPKSKTQTYVDYLMFSKSTPGGDDLGFFTGDFPTQPIYIPGDRFIWSFYSDSNDSEWGFRFTITPQFSDDVLRDNDIRYEKEITMLFKQPSSNVNGNVNWNHSMDLELVKFVNAICEKQKKNPYQLSFEQCLIPEYLTLFPLLSEMDNDHYILLLRFIILKHFNTSIQSFINFIDLKGASDDWSTAYKLCSLRGLLFNDIKLEILNNSLIQTKSQGRRPIIHLNRHGNLFITSNQITSSSSSNSGNSTTTSSSNSNGNNNSATTTTRVLPSQNTSNSNRNSIRVTSNVNNSNAAASSSSTTTSQRNSSPSTTTTTVAPTRNSSPTTPNRNNGRNNNPLPTPPPPPTTPPPPPQPTTIQSTTQSTQSNNQSTISIITIKNYLNNYKNENLFLQSFRQLYNMDPLRLRHNDRAWEVKLEREGARDAGGPYRECITQIVTDLQSRDMNLFLPCQNAQGDVAFNRDKFVPNSSANSPLALQLYEYIGRLIGIAIRTKNCIELSLPSIVWKSLVCAKVDRQDLEAIDKYCTNFLELLEGTSNESKLTIDIFQDCIDQSFTAHSIDNQVVELVSDGKSIQVTWDNKLEYASLLEQYKLSEFKLQIDAMVKGVSSIIPLSILNIFTWQEIEQRVCGIAGLDIKLLKKHTRYCGLLPSEARVAWFWKIIESFSSEEQTLFLRFVWGRSRLPSPAEFNNVQFQIYPFIKNESRIYDDDFEDSRTNSNEDHYQIQDEYLPEAQTCFFTLSIPNYSSLDVMREKLLYAITSCREIDADFVVPDENTSSTSHLLN